MVEQWNRSMEHAWLLIKNLTLTRVVVYFYISFVTGLEEHCLVWLSKINLGESRRSQNTSFFFFFFSVSSWEGTRSFRWWHLWGRVSVVSSTKLKDRNFWQYSKSGSSDMEKYLATRFFFAVLLLWV